MPNERAPAGEGRRTLPPVSPRITAAWFAALAIEHGCTWITCDRDYAHFPGLDWREPTPSFSAPQAPPGPG